MDAFDLIDSVLVYVFVLLHRVAMEVISRLKSVLRRKFFARTA